MKRAIDAVWRLGIRCVYWGLRGWWFVRRPYTQGSCVALWFDDHILLVRASYRPCYTLPGGGVKTTESFEESAYRELQEEIGITLPPSTLEQVYSKTLFYEHRHDQVEVWEAKLNERPKIVLDNREIIEAIWVSRDRVDQYELLPHLEEYFQLNNGAGHPEDGLPAEGLPLNM